MKLMCNPHSVHFLLVTVFLAFSAGLQPALAQPTSNSNSVIAIDASGAVLPESGYLRLGGQSSGGREIKVNNRYLTLEGKPWLPVMGEFHFSRYPEKYWEEEILKMKAGGIQIISTYVFWIHHEEVEGQFDWAGQRDLHHFAELCAKHGMYLFVRIGPWAHGEVRNGGFPDWLLKKGPTRRNDPVYLSYVERFYKEIGNQVKGLLWKDGGPVIGVQLENEYGETGPGTGAEHIAALKTIALKSGLDTPIFTVTGWPTLDFPPAEVIPVFGGYPDGFWFGSLKELPANDIYLFNLSRESFGKSPNYEKFNQPDERLSHYPYLVAEGGGGMATAYHRRPVIATDDVAASMLTRLGSGTNLYGYYMFHGGANPEGKLSTLQESSATDYPNDLTVISYDFQAPLGEFGQMRPSFRQLKLFHLFLHDFGESLAPMVATLPDVIPNTPADAGPTRVSVRSDGHRAFVFFNNYLRNYPLPARNGIQVSIKLATETVLVPKKPVDVPSGAYFIWPVNMDLQGATLKYSTSQPLCKVDHAGSTYYFFQTVPGVAPEFVFDSSTIESIDTGKAAVSREGGRIYVSGIEIGKRIALSVHTHKRGTVHIIVLSQEQARDIWKTSYKNKEYVLFSSADMFFDETNLHLRARDVSELRFGVFPDVKFRTDPDVTEKKKSKGELFFEYIASIKPKKLKVQVEAVRTNQPPAPVKMGKPVAWRDNVAVAVPPEDFDHADLWRVVVPKRALDGLSDAFLRITYVGDTARLYAGPQLLDDDFYKGTVWEVGLKRFAPDIVDTPLEVKILPLLKTAPVYLPANAWPNFGTDDALGKINQIEIVPEYEVNLQVR
ncbi:MAG TPA: beta-galactosidase [Terriglobales bacterium]|nr:beta-galactosidase [Terriglobales bacterium]